MSETEEQAAEPGEEQWGDTRRLADMAARRAVSHPEDGWAADFALEVSALLAEIERLRSEVAAAEERGFDRGVREAGSGPALAAVRAEAEWRGAEKERERNTYRNDDGEELFCPRCGMPDPEGYTREVLDS